MNTMLIILPAIAFIVILASTVAFFAARYRRCPSDKIPRRVWQGRQRAVGHVYPRWREARPPVDPGLALHVPGPDDDRHPAQRRALSTEHPDQRAEHVHRRHQHRSGHHEQRGGTPARSRAKRHRAHGPGDHLRPATADRRLAHDRADQPGPRAVPDLDPEKRRAGAEQDRSLSHQRQHHRHHRRIGLHRQHREEGGRRGGQPGEGRRGRAGKRTGRSVTRWPPGKR